MTYPICKSCNATFQTMEKRQGRWVPIGHDGKVHKCDPRKLFGTTAIALALIGCSSAIKNLEDPAFMPREQVIQASQQCEAADMRPRIVYGWQVVQDRRVAIPLDVQCEPSAWRKSR